MIRLIKNIYHNLNSKLELQSMENDKLTRLVAEASDIVLDKPTEGGFIKIDEQELQKGHQEQTQMEMVRTARKFYRSDPNARAILDTLIHYIMGKGLSITPKSKEPMAWYVWREFWTADRNKMFTRQFEIPLRLFRDGEVFIHCMDRDSEGNATGKTTIRFIDPLQVKNPSTVNSLDNTTRSGIETDPEDVETVTGYWVQSRVDANKFEKLSPEEVIHLKIYSDSDQRRGETLLQAVASMFTHYKQWLDNRIILNKMRTAIVMIRKITGTPSQVQQIADQSPNATNVRSGETKKVNIRGGTILNANPGVSYEMLSPNINAQDVKEDGRNIKLNIAAGTQIPEYIFGDASNANYSSTMISEAPFVKAIEYWQIFLEYLFQQLFKKVINNAVKANILTAPTDDDFLRKLKGVGALSEQEVVDDAEDSQDKKLAEIMPEGKMETPTEIFYGVDVQWPEIIHRNIKELTDALMVARTNGWVADPTCSNVLGYDYNEEVRKQKQAKDNAEVAGNPLMGVEPGGEDDMQAEEDDLMASLTPEEKAAMAKKAEDMMAMAGQGNGNGNGNGQKPPVPSQED
jgi:hypothetical protein